MNTQPVDEFFDSIEDSEIKFQFDYWERLKPINDSERFQRFLFAFMSVHTSWERNVIGYNNIKEWWNWMNRWNVLEEKLIQSRIGLHNNRLRFIKDFTIKFWSNPSNFEIGIGENWTEFRNRIEKNIKGLGLAKSSFAIEMIYPTQAEVTCLDTHLFQAYELNQTKHNRMYHNLENHWVKNSLKKDLPPYIARCIYWDRKQEKQDSRYWSHALEEGDFCDEVINLN
jgi:CRISPR/Cas system CSM-associated protein Csm2 small subunit